MFDKQASKQYNIEILRGIAIFLVIVTHSNMFDMVNKLQSEFDFSKGVDLFFVISGFLMGKTYLAKIDLRSFSLFDAVKFYIRRLSRIIPASIFWGMVLLLFTPIWISMGIFPDALSVIDSVITGVTFLGNLYLNQYMNRLGFWWSLGLEVQFYFILPLLVYLFGKNFWKSIIVIIFILSFPNIWNMEHSWLFRMHSLFLGVITWKCSSILSKNKDLIKLINRSVLGWLGVAIIIIELFLFKSLERYQSFMNFQIGLVFSFILLVFYFIERKLLGFFGCIFVFLGKISFSLYLSHGIIFALIEYYFLDYWKGWVFIMYPLSIYFSYLSYKYIEPLLTKKIKNWSH